MGKSQSKSPEAEDDMRVPIEPWRTIRKKRYRVESGCSGSVRRAVKYTNSVDDLRFLNEYKPGPEDQKLRILLYGPVGAGKSSFINSVQTVLRGRPYSQALVDHTEGDSFTKEYITHQIQKGDDDSFYPFILNDMMGLSQLKGTLVEDVELALKGHVKEGYKFNPETPLSEENQFYNARPTPSDKVHLLVCVIPADKISIMYPEVVEKIKKIRIKASALHIPQVAILTKIDELRLPMHPEINVYTIKGVKEKMKAVQANMGFPLNCMFPVKNYHEEINMNRDIDALILSAMRHIIQYGDDFIKFNQNRFKS